MDEVRSDLGFGRRKRGIIYRSKGAGMWGDTVMEAWVSTEGETVNILCAKCLSLAEPTNRSERTRCVATYQPETGHGALPLVLRLLEA
jgi:hypothetical protein